MREVVVHFPVDLLERVERLADEEERSRPQQLRHLVRLGLQVVEAERRRRARAVEAVAEEGEVLR